MDNTVSNTFNELDKLEITEYELLLYTNIAEHYGVINYFKGEQNILRYIRIAISNRVLNWFDWVCQCFRHEKFRNKTIGIIDNVKDLNLLKYLKLNPKCCYIALRRGATQAYICYIEPGANNKSNIKRHCFDALVEENVDPGYSDRPFNCINAIIDRINTQRSDEFKLTKLIKSLEPLVVRDIF
ncbi:MAG: hypothetical protein EOP34_09395 [Rickettsiales bacterium]|nr:MAG: hypothetical protein EOP34_09395 [Rickettsiales bacterium]